MKIVMLDVISLSGMGLFKHHSRESVGLRGDRSLLSLFIVPYARATRAMKGFDRLSRTFAIELE